MNTGFVRPAVATVLTACGIETCDGLDRTGSKSLKSSLQQYLPLAVLKQLQSSPLPQPSLSERWLQQYLPLAVLKLT